jgi:type I restriction enzyme S subunit
MTSSQNAAAWPTRRLVDCTSDGNISYGIVQPGLHAVDGIPILRVNNFKDGVLDGSGALQVSQSVEKNYRRTRLQGGEVLLTLVGSVGQTSIVSSDFVGWNVARAIAVIRPSKEVSAKWLAICLQSAEVRHFLDGRANTTVQKTLNLGDVKQVPIPIPPIEVRCRIEAMITSLDDKIAVNHRINQTLEAMAQAIFKSWFVDFDPVKAKIAAKAEGRDPLRAAMTTISGKPDAELDTLPPDQFATLAATAALFPDEMEDSELGETPKGWTVQSMAQLTTKIGSGSTPRGGKEVYLDEGIALIRSQNVYDSLFVWEGLARITDEAAAQLKGVTVQENDVLLNITGASILRTCVVLPDVLPARVNQHVAIIRAKPGVPARLLHQYLLLPETKNHLLGLNAGGSREAVTKVHIESLKLLVPGADLLVAFGTLVEPMFKQVESGARDMRALSAVRDTLLPKLLSGELPVHDTEVEVAA